MIDYKPTADFIAMTRRYMYCTYSDRYETVDDIPEGAEALEAFYSLDDFPSPRSVKRYSVGYAALALAPCVVELLDGGAYSELYSYDFEKICFWLHVNPAKIAEYLPSGSVRRRYFTEITADLLSRAGTRRFGYVANVRALDMIIKKALGRQVPLISGV